MQEGKRSENSQKTARRAVDADSDDEATNKMQLIMNCFYLGVFVLVGVIFFWQFYLAEHRPFDS